MRLTEWHEEKDKSNGTNDKFNGKMANVIVK